MKTPLDALPKKWKALFGIVIISRNIAAIKWKIHLIAFCHPQFIIIPYKSMANYGGGGSAVVSSTIASL